MLSDLLIEMEFDEIFHIQRNTAAVDFENSQMIGTSENPVLKMGKIELLQFGIPEMGIKLNLILIMRGMVIDTMPSYCMKFIFYDFSKSIHLFLFDAKIVRVNEIIKNHTNESRWFSVAVLAARSKISETKHANT